MKVLVIYAHPNPKSFCGAIAEKICHTAHGVGHGCEIRDLYKLGFDPVLGQKDFLAIEQGKVLEDIQTEQSAIISSDLMVLVYPVWWSSMPAILKGWLDRVMTKGFAYGQKEGKPALAGKKIMIVSTAGNTEVAFNKIGLCQAMDTVCVDGFCKFMELDVALNRHFFSVSSVSDQERGAMLAVIEQDIQMLLCELKDNN